MEFNQLLRYYGEDGQKETVALALYYWEEYEDRGSEGASKSEIASVVEASRSSVKRSSVSTYLSRLNDWVTTTGSGNHQLTPAGQDAVEAALDDDLLREPRSDRFINTDALDEDEYCGRLVDDINTCYQYYIPDATLVLSRKLFEYLVYQILMGHYSGEDIDMYFDTETRRSLGFKELSNNFADSVTILRQYSRDLDDDVAETVEWFRDQGNTGAHSIRIDVTGEELAEKSPDATRAAEILYDTLQGVRIRTYSEENT